MLAKKGRDLSEKRHNRELDRDSRESPGSSAAQLMSAAVLGGGSAKVFLVGTRQMRLGAEPDGRGDDRQWQVGM